MEEEKKPLDAETEHQDSEEAKDTDRVEETAEQETEKEEPTERRGLFGAKKRERNDKTVLGLYTVAAVYLMYTAFVTGQEIYDGNVASGKDLILKIFFVVLFGGTAAWLLFVCWKLKKRIKQTEEEEAAREAAESGEPMPEKLSTMDKIKNVFASTPTQTEPSVSSRAKVYQNPVEEENETDEESAEDNNGNEDQNKNGDSESENETEE